MKAFAYLRVSGLSQVDGEGFDRQMATIHEYCRHHDIEVEAVYREEGVTGKSELDDRPALKKLISDLLANGVRMVLVEKLDRLARKLIVQETILQDLGRRGITLLSVTEPDACSDDPTRTMIRQILGAFFEYERKMIVSKLADARRRIRDRDGKCEGRSAYGVRAGEKEWLDWMVAQRDAGTPPTAIAEMLNEIPVLTRYGKRWHPGTISKILRRQNGHTGKVLEQG